MSLIKKIDVKNHTSPRYRTKILLRWDAESGDSAAEPDANKADPSNFVADFIAEHSFSGKAAAPADRVTDSISPRAPTVSKRVQT